MTDGGMVLFYLCTLWKTFAPDDVNIITYEFPALYGVISWIDIMPAHANVTQRVNQLSHAKQLNILIKETWTMMIESSSSLQ